MLRSPQSYRASSLAGSYVFKRQPFKPFHTTDFRGEVKSTLYPCLTFLQNLLTLSKTYEKSIYLVSEGFNNPITEAIFGYLLAASKEQASLTVKLIEFDQATSKIEKRKTIHQEKLSPDQRVRIINKQRWISCLENSNEEKTSLLKNAVVVALGGAKGITNSLLQSFSGTDNLHLYISGRSDENDIDVLHNTETLKKNKNTVVNYKSLDATNLPALMKYMNTIIEKHGKIDLLLNGAGVVNVSMLEDKTEEDFDYEIFNKIQPAFNCLAITKELPISRVINFSSVLGRFGGAGQTLYCAANALINSLTESFNTEEHHKTAVSLCWPPWENKGMTESKLVKRQLSELGLSLLTEDKACDLFASDINALSGGSIYYFDNADQSRYAPSAKQHMTSLSLIGSIGKNLVDGFSYKKQFNLKEDNYLSDHLVAGTPYVPAATMISMFYAISQQHHDRNITLKNIDILSPIIVNNETLTHLNAHIREDHLTLSLESVLTHATAESSTNLTPSPASISTPDTSSHIDIGPFYTTKERASQRVYHGNCFQLLQHAYSMPDQQIIFEIDLESIQDIVNNPPYSRMILLLDNAFQAMGIALNRKYRISTLPSKIGALSFIDNEHTLTGYILPSISDINDKRGIGDITIVNATGAPLLCLSNVEMSVFEKQKKAWHLFKR